MTTRKQTSIVESVQNGSTEGRGAITVLLRDGSRAAIESLYKTLFRPLTHFGIPYKVDVLAPNWMAGAASDDALQSAALLLPQSGILEMFSEDFSGRVVNAVQEGLGIICYEPTGDAIPGWLRSLLGLAPFSMEDAAVSGSFQSIITDSNEHFITWTRQAGETVKSDLPMPYAKLTADRPPVDIPLIRNEQGDSLLVTAENGAGRLVLFPFAIDLYDMKNLGHACGLDDVFMKSMVWAARKPFLTWSMPSMAGLVIDDCSGSYDHFGYVDIMNDYGWKPYTALFTDTIDEVAHEDIHVTAKRLKQGWSDGMLEIGFHALRYNDSFCFNHLDQRPLRDDELRVRFARWDWYEKNWGIKHSSWAHPHFGEIGSGALPFYRDRGIEFLTYLLPFDAAWFEVPTVKNPLPPLPPFDHPGYVFTEVPECPGMIVCNCVLDHKNRETVDYVVQTDYLWNHTCFWSESGTDDGEPLIAESAATLAAQLRRGLDSGFYGEGATHEQRYACLRSGEIRELFQETERLMERYTLDKVPLSHAMSAMKQRMQSRLELVDAGTGSGAGSGGLKYRFSSSKGDVTGMQVQIYRNDTAAPGGVDKKTVQLSGSEGVI